MFLIFLSTLLFTLYTLLFTLYSLLYNNGDLMNSEITVFVYGNRC